MQQEMPMAGNAKIFREMRDADAHKKDMQKGIMDRLRDSDLGRAIGQAYDSQLAKGALGGLHDAYRRIYENGWYGKDVFDGRFHMDNSNIMDLDQRAAVYGVGTGKEQEMKQDMTKEAEAARQIEQNRELDRDDDLEIGR
jgi:hypothetical protein